MALTKRLIKGSKLTLQEGDDNLDWLGEAGEISNNIALLNRATGVNHAADDGNGNLINALTESSITVDVSNAVPNGWDEFFMNLTTNPVINVIGGTATVVYPNSDSIATSGNYRIVIRWAFGRINVYIPNATGSASAVQPPTNLAAGTATDTTIPLTWTKSITGVMIEYRVYIGGTFQQSFTGDVASGTLTGLTANTTYNNITVRAFDGTNESSDSNSINVTTAAGAATAPSYVSKGSLVFGSGTIAADYPGSLTSGLQLYAFYWKQALADPGSAPTGWTIDDSSKLDQGVEPLSIVVLKKDVLTTGSESGTVDFAFGTGAAAEDGFGIMVAFDGTTGNEGKLFSPFELGTGQTFTNTNSQTVNNVLSCAFFFQTNNVAVTPTLIGYTQRIQEETFSGGDALFAMCDQVLATTSDNDGSVQYVAASSMFHQYFGFYLLP